MDIKERGEAVDPSRTDRRAFLDRALKVIIAGGFGLGSLSSALRAKAATAHPQRINDLAPTVKLRSAVTQNRATGLAEPDSLSRDVFARNLNTEFEVWNAPDVLKAELIAVKDRESSADPSAPNGGEAFSIFFRIAGNRPLKQATYRFDHNAIGAFFLFIVPVDTDRNYVYYEAGFNRASARLR